MYDLWPEVDPLLHDNIQRDEAQIDENGGDASNFDKSSKTAAAANGANSDHLDNRTNTKSQRR